MKKAVKQLLGMNLVGVTLRTSNALEMNLETAKIAPTIQKFLTEGMQDRIVQRKNPGRLFSVYTEYESDEHGEYTYFFGEEVENFVDVDSSLKTLSIPEQTYVKLTSDPGAMPEVVIKLWQEIWGMSATELGGERAYIADFEIYDPQQQDPTHTVVDIYVGMKTPVMA